MKIQVKFFTMLSMMAVCVLMFACDRGVQTTAHMEEHSAEKKNNTEKTDEILFWIYPKGNMISSYVEHPDIYENGVENKDLSDTMIVGVAGVISYGTEDYDFIKSIPVTRHEFETTKNAKMKILRHAKLSIDFKKCPLSFRGWTLDSVDFSESYNISECDFTDANISNSYFHNTEVTSTFDRTSDGETILRLINEGDRIYPKENRLTFEQFASTVTYRHDDLRGIRLAYVNLSDWNFEGKDISTMVFSNCYYKGKKISGTGLTPDIFKTIDQEIETEKEKLQEEGK